MVGEEIHYAEALLHEGMGNGTWILSMLFVEKYFPIDPKIFSFTFQK